MREIKFRGKRIDTGEWVYGDLWRLYYSGSSVSWVIRDGHGNMEDHEVDPETVGQFIGLHDRNGKEIYEGNVCSWKYGFISGVSEVRFFDGAFRLHGYPFDEHNLIATGERLEVIGNIHENPELLK